MKNGAPADRAESRGVNFQNRNRGLRGSRGLNRTHFVLDMREYRNPQEKPRDTSFTGRLPGGTPPFNALPMRCNSHQPKSARSA